MIGQILGVSRSMIAARFSVLWAWFRLAVTVVVTSLALAGQAQAAPIELVTQHTNGELGGLNYPLCVENPSLMTQTVNFPAPGTYQLSISTNFYTGALNRLSVQLDGTQIIFVQDQSWLQHLVNHTVSGTVSEAGPVPLDLLMCSHNYSVFGWTGYSLLYTPDVPTATSLGTTAGPTTGGNSVTITGSGFGEGDVTVTVDGTPVSLFNVTVNSPTSLTYIAPAHPAGNVGVTVTTSGGTTGNIPGGYLYLPAPTASSLTPAAGPTSGGTISTLTGTDFFPGVTSVTIGGTVIPAASVSVNSATSLSFMTPANAAGNVPVSITTPGGTTANIPGGFTFFGPPTVSGLSPASGPTAGGTMVTISGTNFIADDTTVTIGGAVIPANSVTVNSATSLTFVTPPDTGGSVAISVSTSVGTSGYVPDDFTYVYAPTVSSLSPSAGPVAGGTTVSIFGTNFVAGATTVTVDGAVIPAGSVTVNSPGSLSFAAPAHAAGNVAISVTTVGGTSSVVPGGFTYRNAPVVTGISPAVGPSAGGTSTTITGTGFLNSTSVHFGSTSVGAVVVDDTTIVATSPAGTGVIDVVITTPGGSSAAGAGSKFSYQGAQVINFTNPGPQLFGSSPTLAATATSGLAVEFSSSTTGVCTITPGGTLTFVATGSCIIDANQPGDATYVAASTVSQGFAVNLASVVVTPGSGALPDGTVGTAYSQTLSASGGTAPYSYAVTAGSLPPGLTLDAGVISGTPTDAGDFTLMVIATETNGGFGTADYTISINKPVATIVLDPSGGALETAVVGQAYDAEFTASGGVGTMSFAITTGALPDGLTLDAATGQVSGKPAADSAGDYAFTLTATDSDGNTASGDFALKVTSPVKAADQNVVVVEGSEPGLIDLTAGATGGPFDGATVVGVVPPQAGTATIIEMDPAAARAAKASERHFFLKFVPSPGYVGTAEVKFTLHSAFGTSPVAVISYKIERDLALVRETFENLAKGFVDTRSALLAGSVKAPGLIDRRAMGSGSSPGSLTASPSGNDLTVGLSTSSLALGGWNQGTPLADQGVNFWIDATGTLHVRTEDGDDHWGSFALVSAGADVLVNDKLLVGLAVHGDWMEDLSDVSTATGRGVLVGPYISAEIGDGLFFDASLFYGRSWNDVSNDDFAGEFETERLLAKASLQGLWQLSDELSLRPSANVFYLHEATEGFSVEDDTGNSVDIDGFSTDALRLSAGGTLSYVLVVGEEWTVVPYLDLQLGLALANDATSGFATVGTGLTLSGQGAWSINLGTQADLQADGIRAISAKASLTGQF